MQLQIYKLYTNNNYSNNSNSNNNKPNKKNKHPLIIFILYHYQTITHAGIINFQIIFVKFMH